MIKTFYVGKKAKENKAKAESKAKVKEIKKPEVEKAGDK